MNMGYVFCKTCMYDKPAFWEGESILHSTAWRHGIWVWVDQLCILVPPIVGRKVGRYENDDV